MRTRKDTIVPSLLMLAVAYHLGNALDPKIGGVPESILNWRLEADLRSRNEDNDISARFVKQFGALLRYKAGQIHPVVYVNRREPYFEIYPRGDLPPHRPELVAVRGKIDKLFGYLRERGVTPVLWAIPNKVALYREKLPAAIPCVLPFISCPNWTESSSTFSAYEKTYTDFISNVPGSAPDLLKVYRDEVRARPGDPLIGPWEYHWSTFGLAVALRELAPFLGARTQPLIRAVKQAQFPKGYLLEQMRIPDYYFTTAKEFQSRETQYETVAPLAPKRWPRVILAGTSFSSGESRYTPTGQLRSWGIEVINFARAGGGHNGSFEAMKSERFEFEPGDTFVWELPTCCAGHDERPIYFPPVRPHSTRSIAGAHKHPDAAAKTSSESYR